MRRASRKSWVVRLAAGFALAAAAVGCNSNPATPSSLTGNWTGSVTLVVVGANTATGSLQLVLTQNGSTITGTATETFTGSASSNNASESVAWTLNGTALSGTLTSGSCLNNVTATLSGSTISGSITSSSSTCSQNTTGTTFSATLQ